ncbi:MAG TPA: hypothetical protein VL307_15540, partial [Chitinophagaceae bacterium]|nr:hypothetical protein [Chitinophagaceae bacterium]
NKAVDSYSEIKNLLSFSTKNKLTDAFVTTLDASAEKEIGGVNINFVPSAEYAYNVGNNTIAHQYSKLQ